MTSFNSARSAAYLLDQPVVQVLFEEINDETSIFDFYLHSYELYKIIEYRITFCLNQPEGLTYFPSFGIKNPIYFSHIYTYLLN